jgi:alkylation response protein AidB-like acyl-CoA dehydrogenase
MSSITSSSTSSTRTSGSGDTTRGGRKGGAWILEDAGAAADSSAGANAGGDEIFTPEKLSDEHRMIARTAGDFVTHEVLPQLDRLEAKDWPLCRDLLQRCGALGLLGTDAPEAYGGVDLDKISSILVAEAMACCPSFGTTFGAMTGLSIMPLLGFGTEAQKQRYLPGLVSGEIVGAYALSESGSGSDALGARARATRQADGSFRLTGEKMWITNGGFADIFITFAKIDGEHFTAFIVERAFPGVSHGREEHKMGLHGSSTAPLILQDAQVPAENLLGEIGKGHKVAFNVLNYGRFKLGAMAVGGAKAALAEAATYAGTRKQFGKPIASFGAIKFKLAEMQTQLYAVESLLYRTAISIDDAIGAASAAASGAGGAASATHAGATGHGDQARLTAVEEFAVECSIAKVMGSEMLDYVIDENVQIHGGNGYVRDYPAEGHYRDARVNRIFEGTNEINRLLITGMLMRRALKGDLALIPAARQLQEELLTPSLEMPGDDLLDAEQHAVRGFKKVCLMLLGLSMQTYGDKVSDEQEILSWTSDVLIDTFAADSVLRRARQAHDARLGNAPLHVDTARLFINDAASRIETTARQALAAMAEGDMLRVSLAALRRLLRITPINTVSIRRRLAEATVAKGAYIFS